MKEISLTMSETKAVEFVSPLFTDSFNALNSEKIDIERIVIRRNDLVEIFIPSWNIESILYFHKNSKPRKIKEYYAVSILKKNYPDAAKAVKELDRVLRDMRTRNRVMDYDEDILTEYKKVIKPIAEFYYNLELENANFNY